MKEIWKPIKGFEGYYEVSTNGRVRSVDRIIHYSNGKVVYYQGKIISQSNRVGYLRVDLNKDGKHKSYNVHRLVAEAFLENPNNLQCVNHKDENKQNNNINNLEWCSSSYNNSYGTRLKRLSKSLTNNPKKSRPIHLWCNGEFVGIFPSMREAQRLYDISNLSNLLKGKCHYVTNKNGDKFTATYVSS